MKNSWEVATWIGLKKLVTLKTVKAALKEYEQKRLYYRNAYLKRQAILENISKRRTRKR